MGYGKRVPISKFRLQNRAGMGVRAMKFKTDDDCLVGIDIVNPEDELNDCHQSRYYDSSGS